MVFYTYLIKNHIKLWYTLLLLAACLFLFSALILLVIFLHFFIAVVVNMSGQTPSDFNNPGSGQNSNPGQGPGPGPGGKPNYDAMLDELERQIKKVRNRYLMSIGYIFNDKDSKKKIV